MNGLHIHQKIRQIVRFDPKPQFQSVVILSYNRKNDRNEHKTEKGKAPDLGLFQWLRGRFSFTTQMSGFLFCLAEKALLTQKAPIYQ
jgi:hypothetical protein